ncbi:MAG: restriction endonuclease subunit S [Gammaproteobacteria bacterium]|nr:restriction endonuclease subunit S [Gammaproteobacteria bacterium]
MSNKYLFKQIVQQKGGFLRGPFGGDLKKEIFVEKGLDTYKVYEQGVVLNSDKSIGRYYISEKDYLAKLHKFSVRDKDFLVSCSGVNMGAIYQLKEPFERGIINQALLRIRLNAELIDDNYFYYLFKKLISKKIISGSGDSTIPNFPGLNVIKNIEFELPIKSIQEKIGKILFNIDSKIEFNNRINAELEAITKTLYEYWFVQFDFPDKNGNPYKTSGGKMIWNAELKREIPEYWKNGKLCEIANIIMGQSPPGESYNDKGKGMIFFQGCTDFGDRFPTVRQFTTQPTRLAKEGDILLSVRAPVGTMNIAKENCCIGRGLAALNSKDNCIAYLFGVMINLKQIFDRRNVNGTTFGSITKDDLFSLKVINPDKEILKKYHKIIKPAYEKQNKIAIENQKLAELRDWLLPMLINGQVTVINEKILKKKVASASF